MRLEKIFSKSIGELRKAGINTADIDVRVILRYVLGKDDVYLLTHNNDLLTNAQYQKFRRLIRRRKKGEPVAYLTGEKEFYALNFSVNKHVLIPRPETEVLVDAAITFIQQKRKSKVDKIKVIDVGTGSGCIAVAIAKTYKPLNSNIRYYASDISAKALSLAKKNSLAHGTSVNFYKSDLLHNKKLPKKFDLIIANLPYLTRKDRRTVYRSPDKVGLDYEPKIALYASDSGFELIQRLLHTLPCRLESDGKALIETDESHKTRIVALAEKLSLKCKQTPNRSHYQGFFELTSKQ